MFDAVSHLNAPLEGRYAIERELGEGGMAAIFLPRDLKHERKVALKVLKPELAALDGTYRGSAILDLAKRGMEVGTRPHLNRKWGERHQASQEKASPENEVVHRPRGG